MSIGRRYNDKKTNKRIFIIRIIQLTLICCMIWSLTYIIKWLKENKKSSDLKNSFKEVIKIDDNNNYIVDFTFLKNINNDTVAWVKVNNTNIEYPVVKTNNNDYYLYHSFDKSSSSAGWIFADYRNKFNGRDRNIVIYGHNRRNGSMFGTLNKILKRDWYENEENRNILLITEEKKYIYKVFSIYEISVEDYYTTINFDSDEEYVNFLEKIKSRSIYNFNEEVDKTDNILTLSTCGISNNNRVVLHAKKIK